MGRLSLFKNRYTKANGSEKEMERCVLCGCLTDILRDCAISERQYYVEGAGQLCRECFSEVYGSAIVEGLSDKK